MYSDFRITLIPTFWEREKELSSGVDFCSDHYALVVRDVAFRLYRFLLERVLLRLSSYLSHQHCASFFVVISGSV